MEGGGDDGDGRDGPVLYTAAAGRDGGGPLPGQAPSLPSPPPRKERPWPRAGS